jgi:serine/threonine protein kinase
MEFSTGGKVINSGGFGCIFLPEIICKNKNKNKHNKNKHNKTKKISKMMLNRHASDEYNQIMKIKQLVKKIPNYGDYFVIKNIDICKIKKLTNEDLEKYQEKCSALQKYKITKKNIRKSLDKISIVNIPYAGIALDKFIESKFTISRVTHLNKLLIELLNKAVIPMNNYGVFHSDIKASNILINESHKKVRFIDWGLTVTHPQKFFTEIPSKWKNRPFQFNVPFEVILFTDDFVSKMNDFIEKYDNKSTNNGNKMFQFVNDYIYYWLNERGKGHLSYIHSILSMLDIIKEIGDANNNDSETKSYTKTKEKYVAQFGKYKETIDFITNYIVFILAKFTEFNNNGSFEMLNYINKIYKNYVDVWGLLITYIPIIEILYENKSKLEDSHKLLFYTLQKILIKHLYTPKVEIINLKTVSKDLKNMNTVLKKFSKNEYNPTYIDSHINSSITETPITII